jgi:hypothetical protein
MSEGCVFCDHDRLREADPYFENDLCIYASTRDPRDPPDVMPGAGAPDSYTLGWNDNGLHPHLHVIPRFDDEPMADRGVRSGIKDPANRRPDPWRPGTGRHMSGS